MLEKRKYDIAQTGFCRVRHFTSFHYDFILTGASAAEPSPPTAPQGGAQAAATATAPQFPPRFPGAANVMFPPMGFPPFAPGMFR